jgi:hypothetical protein
MHVLSVKGGEEEAAKLAEATATFPDCPAFQLALADIASLEGDARRSYCHAMAGLQCAERARHGFAAAELAVAALRAARRGALGGEHVRLSALQPLAARARAALGASRSAVPHTQWDALSKTLARAYKKPLARLAAQGATILRSAPAPACAAAGPALDAAASGTSRVCTSCGVAAAEMLQCSSFCKAGRTTSYCSLACQQAHWPEHKAACKAARRRGGRGGAESLRVLNGFCGRRSGGVSTQLAPLRA